MNKKKNLFILIIGLITILSALMLCGCGNNEPDPIAEEPIQQEEQDLTDPEPAVEKDESEKIQYVLYLKHRDQPFIFSDSYQISETDERLQDKTLSEFVLEELIKQEGIGELINPMPDNTEIISVEHEGRMVIVNLSQDFVDNITGTEEDVEATIGMIVNSLVTLPENDQVRLLVEGELLENIGGLKIHDEYEFITTYYPDK